MVYWISDMQILSSVHILLDGVKDQTYCML